MAKTTLPAMVEGGKATPAPPLGPALAPSGLNVVQVIAAINEKTKDFVGMQVPIKVIFEKGVKEFEIEVGTPPASALIKKELGLKEPVKEEAGVKGKKTIGNVSLSQLVKIAGMKKDASLATSLKTQVKELAGTCLSLGVTIEGKNPREFIREVGEGKFDSQLAG
ncbi:MAG TPA: 50S ribosomal protein L11 [Candidatus Norongarragalinales archaeon]|nr:50S ribosomal protein L11 [Candidatus Norongarragalinales archaeon]